MSKAQRDPGRGYGNIYTPHAGSMIIHVQRETGLANRTLVLSQRKVRLLRILSSKLGVLLLATVCLSWLYFAVQAARVPVLERELSLMQREAARIETLERTLHELQERYAQVQRMLGAAPAAPTPAAAGTSSAPAATTAGAPRAGDAPR